MLSCARFVPTDCSSARSYRSGTT